MDKNILDVKVSFPPLGLGEDWRVFAEELNFAKTTSDIKTSAFGSLFVLARDLGSIKAPVFYLNDNHQIELTWRDDNKNHLDIRIIDFLNMQFVVFKNNNGEMLREYGKSTILDISKLVKKLKLQHLLVENDTAHIRSKTPPTRPRAEILQTFNQPSL